MSHFTRSSILDKHSDEDMMTLTFKESMLRLLDICISISKTHIRTKKPSAFNQHRRFDDLYRRRRNLLSYMHPAQQH